MSSEHLGKLPAAVPDAAPGEARLLGVLCLAGFATSISWRASDPMLPALASSLGVSLNQAVLLASAYSLPFALMQLVFGPLGDAWGKIRLMRFSLGVVAVSLLAIALAPNFAAVLCARVVSGAFAGGVNPMALALLGERVALERRAVALGRFMVAMIGGQMLGAAAAGLLVDLIGWRLVFGLAAVTVAGICGLTIALIDNSGDNPGGGSEEARRPLSFSRAYADYRRIFAGRGAFLVMGMLVLEGIFVLGLVPFVAGLLLQRAAGGAAEAGIVIGMFAVGGMLFGMAVKPIVAALGPWNMVRAGGALAGAGLFCAALPLHWTASGAGFFAVGFGFYMMHNSIAVRITELGPHARGAGVSVGAFSFITGQAIGPAVWSLAAHSLPYAVLFMTAGVLTVALGLVAAPVLGSRFATAGPAHGRQ